MNTHYAEQAMRKVLSDAEIERIRIRAERIQPNTTPDGAVQYVPQTAAYAMRHLVARRTMQQLMHGDENE